MESEIAVTSAPVSNLNWTSFHPSLTEDIQTVLALVCTIPRKDASRDAGSSSGVSTVATVFDKH